MKNIKKRTFTPSILLLALAVLTACSSDNATVVNINVKAFQSKIQESGVVVLDVRTQEEFASGHIANAVNIDVEQGSFDSEISKLDKSLTYAVYCHSGRRSNIATQKMAGARFASLFNLDGGVSSWLGFGLGLVTQ